MKYALYLSFYWMSACFVYGYTRLYMGQMGFSADEVGLLLGFNCGASMLLQPLLARVLDRSGRVTMAQVLLGLCAVALVCGGLLLFPQGEGRIVLLFAALSIMTMTIQPFVVAVGFDYIDRGEKLNYAVTRSVASLAFALISKVYAALADLDARYLLGIYLLFTAGVLLCSLDLAPRTPAIQKAPAQTMGRGSLLKAYPAFFGMLLGIVLLFFQHNFLDAYLYDVILAVGGGTGELGTALLIGAAVETPMMLLFDWVERRFGAGRVLTVSILAMALKPWLVVLLGSTWGVYLMRFSHFVSFAPFLLAITYYANRRMAPEDKVTGQALITGAISLSGLFSYLVGGLLITAGGALWALTVVTLVGMAGGGLLLLFAARDKRPGNGGK